MPEAVPSIAPALSVILATPASFSVIRKVVSHLQRQTVRDRLELVLVASSRGALELDEAMMEGFASHQVVEIGDMGEIGRANAAGIRRATAPVVVLAEDHCFPDADWAERLIETHKGPWAAVGPAVRNANPGSAVSWADLFIGYGPWLEPVAAGEADFLPGHNTSYKRELLLEYGDRLDSLLGAETLLHWDLRSRKYHLYLEPRARVAHTNFSLWSSWLPVQLLNGRAFAGARRNGMTLPVRLLYIVGSPLIPWVRLARVIRATKASALRSRLLTTTPALVIGLLLDGAGQLLGYALGPGDSVGRLAGFEFARVNHVTARDRREVFGT